MEGKSKKESKTKNRRLDVLLDNLETEKEKKIVRNVEEQTQDLLLQKNSLKLRLKKD